MEILYVPHEVLVKVSISFHRFQSRLQEISRYFFKCSFMNFYIKFLCSLYVVYMKL